MQIWTCFDEQEQRREVLQEGLIYRQRMGLLHLINASTLAWFLQMRKNGVLMEQICHQTISIPLVGKVFTFCCICLARDSDASSFCVHNTEQLGFLFSFVNFMFYPSYLDKLSGRLVGSEICH